MIERLRVDNRDLGIEFFEELYFQKKLTPAAYFIGKILMISHIYIQMISSLSTVPFSK